MTVAHYSHLDGNKDIDKQFIAPSTDDNSSLLLSCYLLLRSPKATLKTIVKYDLFLLQLTEKQHPFPLLCLSHFLFALAICIKVRKAKRRSCTCVFKHLYLLTLLISGEEKALC